MAIKDRIQAVTLQSQSAALFTGTFVVVNANGLPESCFLLRLTNASNRDVFISFDGVTEHEFIQQGGVVEVYGRPEIPNERSFWPKKLRVYVKSSGGAGTGALYVSAYYMPQ